ncbi:RNA-directed RNA polymerase [ssRNA phage Gerhypos.1_37]|uniref:RNA-directed RNA polymerase n=2 Tax=Leviviricetes TaxID=2842243 RepID=A0A8S5KZK8_9VIRU|nr:RNA-directed RNA polymerase [ssRNA phage Gerhypos.1_37]QDH89059.1 MAG: RNA-dependent RNA polymerase [Leviviridae sp.]DAD50607.1 TPA_asm: RNA-directed RNA polymerase [ssRNA phage Gerhypos.1_37]
MFNTGDLKSLGLLWTNLATTSYSEWVTERDIKTFSDRLEHEGLAFLTTTLPTLGKAIDNFHSTSEWVPPPDFKTHVADTWRTDTSFQPRDDFFVSTEKHAGIARFIPDFLGKAVYFALAGSSSAVDCVRQLAFMFYKLEVDYDEETKKQYLDRFIQNDLDLANAIDFEDDFTSKLVAEMRRMVCRILCNEDPLDIRPSHGAGATACRTSNENKYHLVRYYAELDAVFSYPEYFYFSPTHLADEMGKLEDAQESVPRARVCLVPKDSRGPRIISCEPAELLYIQQGLMKKLYRCLETSPLTAGQVNFTDQSINQQLAESSSLTGEYATIDLSDASDRVSLDLIRAVFPPRWVEALEACRSESTILPDGRVVKLKKFAPMGSSCCFPVEALVFWTCAQATRRILSPNSRVKMYVYGDDIIVPSSFYEETVCGLETIGLKVNRSKSFFDGPFRESCGGEYHRGVDVTPVRVRKFIKRQGSGLATNADLANCFLVKFGEEKSLPLIKIIEEQQGYIFPRTQLSYPATLRLDPSISNDVFFRRRWNVDFQRWEHRVLCLSSTQKKVHPPNWGELLRKELCKDVAVSGKYTHPLAIMDSVLEPGYYTESHSVRAKWQWSWLG